MVESIRKTKTQYAIERRYYLTGLPLDAKYHGRAVRSHWRVENSLHWSLDVTFREDDSRARTRNAAQNLATMRRFVLNIAKKGSSGESSLRSKRFVTSLNQEYLERPMGI